ncbi:MAG: hypothetical protein NC930_04720 [Candidatus Omnitrophica bacterium]|nr:hypothetical protein [Candidatus Omnitrophota bacterium]
MKLFTLLLIFQWMSLLPGYDVLASEVIPQTDTKVVIRKHPRTGEPYVCIIPSTGEVSRNPLPALQGTVSRPDYRLLDPNVKAREVPYQGPYSNRKRVYILAASLATVGTVGGAVGLAAAPAATGTAASGGAGVFAAGGTAVVTGAAAAVHAQTKINPEDENYSHTAQAESVRLPSENVNVQKNAPLKEDSTSDSVIKVDSMEG